MIEATIYFVNDQAKGEPLGRVWYQDGQVFAEESVMAILDDVNEADGETLDPKMGAEFVRKLPTACSRCSRVYAKITKDEGAVHFSRPAGPPQLLRAIKEQDVFGV